MKLNVETVPTKHLKTDTFEKTKEAYYHSARKGRLNIDTFRSFANLFGEEIDRTVFISTLYDSCKNDLDKEAIDAVCRIKGWEFNDLAKEEHGKTNENEKNEPTPRSNK